MEIKRLALVLVDISGYTRFVKMHTMSLLHAESIITDLLGAVIDNAEFPLTLSKLEGDAAFLRSVGVFRHRSGRQCRHDHPLLVGTTGLT